MQITGYLISILWSHISSSVHFIPFIRLDLFRMLTQDGKDLKFFEDEAGRFLLQWMRDVISCEAKMPDYLQVLVNVMKYNAAYVDEKVVTGFVL